jgi:hypothetical protein
MGTLLAFLNVFCWLHFLILLCRNLDSAVGIVTGYGLDGQGVGVRVLVGVRFLSSPRCPHRFWSQPPIQWVSWALSPGGKATGA